MLLTNKYSITKERAREFFINLLIVTFILFAIILELNLTFFFPVNEPLIFLNGLLAIFFIYLNKFRFSFFKINKSIFLIATLFFFILINSIFVRNYILVGAIFNLITGFSIAYQLIKNKNSEYLYLIPFWFLVIYILIRLSINVDPNTVFIRSRNYISFFLIITVVPYYFLKFYNNKPASLVPILVLLILSIYSLSRSGSVSAFILFGAVILSKKIDKKVSIILVSFFFTTILYFLNFLVANYNEASEFSRLIDILPSVENEARFIIFMNYINQLDFFGFLIGMDTNDAKILDFGGSYIPGHVHSSIINFISVVGIGFFLFFYYIFKTLKLLYNYNISMMLFFVAVLLRSFTDTGLLFSYFDYVIWVFVMTMFFLKRKAF